MSNKEERVVNCYDSQLNKFTIYDQAVDVVSCWQAILTHGYKNKLQYFDRFPNIPPRGLTPDFTVLFKNGYGLIFEIKRTYPNEDIAIRKEIRQLKSYDSNLSLKADDSGNRATPNVTDIVLILNTTHSNMIFTRINKILKDNDFGFNNNSIFLDYLYLPENNYPKYAFRKFMGDNRKFRDEVLPKKSRFEYILGDQVKDLECPIKYFIPYKIIEVLCNDAPPELYMAVYLWSKIFYSFLDDYQIEDWRKGNPQKIQKIYLNIENLMNDLNKKYIPNDNIRRKWITDTIDFLEVNRRKR